MPAARDWLADKGYDPAYGARPLKRVIQKSVQDPLAELILSGQVKDGEKVDDLGRQAGPHLQRQARRGSVIGRSRVIGSACSACRIAVLTSARCATLTR